MLRLECRAWTACVQGGLPQTCDIECAQKFTWFYHECQHLIHIIMSKHHLKGLADLNRVCTTELPVAPMLQALVKAKCRASCCCLLPSRCVVCTAHAMDLARGARRDKALAVCLLLCGAQPACLRPRVARSAPMCVRVASTLRSRARRNACLASGLPRKLWSVTAHSRSATGGNTDRDRTQPPRARCLQKLRWRHVVSSSGADTQVDRRAVLVPSNFSCSGIRCEKAEAPTHGLVNVSNNGHYPSIATYACESKAYELYGSSTRKCGTDGKWRGGAPICSGTSWPTTVKLLPVSQCHCPLRECGRTTRVVSSLPAPCHH